MIGSAGSMQGDSGGKRMKKPKMMMKGKGKPMMKDIEPPHPGKMKKSKKK